ncbi:MAG: LCP family protein [Nocardioidaceae bacterium]|nr:LCP family protein [Nocardioidaceae bacterium]
MSSTAARPRRTRRVLVILLLLLLGLLGGVLAWGLYLQSQLAGIPRFPVTHPGPRPARVPGHGVTFLLAGVDASQGGGDLRAMLASGRWTPGSYRSDALSVVHLAADRSHAEVISIPRDTWTTIPGHGRAKVNAAMSLGGPSLTVQTVEQLTRTRIDHVAVVDFGGFRGLTSALGGVDVYVPRTVHDSARDYTWTRGWHHVEGEQALLYVRERHGLPGSDFDRIQRQQNLLRAVAAKLRTYNPVTLTRVAGELAALVSLDDALGDGELRSLVLSLRHLRPSRVTYATVPVTGTPTIAGQSVVTIDVALTRSLFDAVESGTLTDWRRTHDLTELPQPKSVR